MDEKMTRKGFLAAAAAAGVAALAPSVAHAADGEGSDAEAALLDELGVEVDRGSDALAASKWAEMAASQTDVYKSRNGAHVMNAPAYFGFSGWDEAHDQPTDLGFVYSGDGMIVRGRRMRFELGAVYGDLADFVVEEGSSGGWGYRKWASGKADCWIRRSYSIPSGAWSASAMYSGAYSANGSSCPGGVPYPVAFSAAPCEIFTFHGPSSRECEMFCHATAPNTQSATGFHQLYRTGMAVAKELSVSYSVSVSGSLA